MDINERGTRVNKPNDPNIPMPKDDFLSTRLSLKRLQKMDKSSHDQQIGAQVKGFKGRKKTDITKFLFGTGEKQKKQEQLSSSGRKTSQPTQKSYFGRNRVKLGKSTSNSNLMPVTEIGRG